jgi:hypothetical protein
MLVVRLAVIAHNFHSSDHFSNREKPQDLGEHDSGDRQLSAVDVADGAQDGFGVHRAGGGAGGGHDGTRIAENVGNRLEVGLELSHRTARY